MIKVGDKVRILANKAGTAMLHHFPIGSIVEVTAVINENNVIAEGYCGNNDTLSQLLVNYKDCKQFERVEDNV